MPQLGAIYHDGVDIAVRDDRPERGAPRGRTHRVYAIEGGPVFLATPPGVRGFVHVGHFGYGHVDALVQPGETVAPGNTSGGRAPATGTCTSASSSSPVRPGSS